MKLHINGETLEFEEAMTLQQIMQQLKIEEKVMACAVNMQIVKKEEWASYKPAPEDKIEMLHFVGGG